MKKCTKKRMLFLTAILFAFAMSFLFSTDSSAATKNGWVVSKGATYYKKGGKNIKGLQKIGKYYYYFDSNGRMRTGFKRLRGRTFYFRTSGKLGKRGRMVTGWAKINGKTYYFKKTGKKYKKGKMLTGWHRIRKKVFYFKANGQMVTGAKKINGKSYYFRKTGSFGTCGSVFTGKRTIKNVTYYYRKSGKLGTIGSLYKTKKKTTTSKSNASPSASSSKINKRTMTSEQFVAYIGKLARKDMKKTGVLASVTTAQAILESGYGKSTLAQNANNLFGIKSSGKTYSSSAWSGRVYRVSTKEFVGGCYITIMANFRAYSSWEDSLLDHSSYLKYAKNGSKYRYAGISTCRSYRRAAQIIKNGGYATSPDYVDLICKLIQRWNLTKYDA